MNDNIYMDSTIQGRIQDLKLGGYTKKDYIWGILCQKSRFYAKKSYFFPILGGRAPPGSAPATVETMYA